MFILKYKIGAVLAAVFGKSRTVGREKLPVAIVQGFVVYMGIDLRSGKVGMA